MSIRRSSQDEERYSSQRTSETMIWVGLLWPAMYTYAIAETFSDPKLNVLVQNQRMEKGIDIIPLEGSARKILRVLRDNQFVALLIDRPSQASEGIPITFFGRKTYVPAGTATLALKSGAAIMPGYI